MNKNVKSIICRYGLFINIFITIKLTLNSFIPTLNFKICRYIPQLTKQYYSNIIMRILGTVIKKKKLGIFMVLKLPNNTIKSKIKRSNY